MQEKYKNVVKLEGTSADAMQCIIDFIYTGKLDICRENSLERLVAADYLRVESEKFMLRHKFLFRLVCCEHQFYWSQFVVKPHYIKAWKANLLQVKYLLNKKFETKITLFNYVAINVCSTTVVFKRGVIARPGEDVMRYGGVLVEQDRCLHVAFPCILLSLIFKSK